MKHPTLIAIIRQTNLKPTQTRHTILKKTSLIANWNTCEELRKNKENERLELRKEFARMPSLDAFWFIYVFFFALNRNQEEPF